jgi:hypothetical protein
VNDARRLYAGKARDDEPFLARILLVKKVDCR